MDLNANLERMDVAELLDHQQALSRQRKEVLAAQQNVQRELDRRTREIAERRAHEDRLLGAVTKAPPQQVFGTNDGTTEAPAVEAGS